MCWCHDFFSGRKSNLNCTPISTKARMLRSSTQWIPQKQLPSCFSLFVPALSQSFSQVICFKWMCLQGTVRTCNPKDTVLVRGAYGSIRVQHKRSIKGGLLPRAVGKERDFSVLLTFPFPLSCYEGTVYLVPVFQPPSCLCLLIFGESKLL